MNGLLHRLAARAAGTARTLRSDAVLPFAMERPAGTLPELEPAPPGRPPRAAPDDDRAAHGTPGADRPHRPARPAPSADAAPGAAAHLVSPPALAKPAVRAQPAPADPAARAAAAAPAGARRKPSAPRERSEPAGVGAPPAPAPDAAGADLPARPVLERERLVRVVAPAAAGRSAVEPPAAEATRRTNVPARDAQRAGAEPAPAASERPPVAPLVARPTAPFAMPPAPFAARPHAAPDEPAEVQIHIGRIEVTALHEAPKLRQQSAPQRSAPSLAAYLAQRSRR